MGSLLGMRKQCPQITRSGFLLHQDGLRALAKTGRPTRPSLPAPMPLPATLCLCFTHPATSWYPSQPPGTVLPLPLAQLVIKHPIVTPAVLVKAQIRDFSRHLISAKAISSQVLCFPVPASFSICMWHLPSAPWYLLKTSVLTAQCQTPHGDLQMLLGLLSPHHAEEDPDVPSLQRGRISLGP